MKPPSKAEPNVTYVVYYQARTARGAPKPWYWACTGDLDEKEAKRFYERMVDYPHENIRHPRIVQRTEVLIGESNSGGK